MMGALGRNSGGKARRIRREIRAPREKRGRVNSLLHSQPRLGGPGWRAREITGWQVCQGEAELLRPHERGQLRPGEALFSTGVLSWGKVPEHWDGHLIYSSLGRVFCLCVGEEAFPFRKPRVYVLGNSEGNTVGAQAGRTWAWWPPGQRVFSLDPFK